MEVHIERLKHLCRICGQKIVVKRGYISYQGSLEHAKIAYMFFLVYLL